MQIRNTFVLRKVLTLALIFFVCQANSVDQQELNNVPPLKVVTEHLPPYQIGKGTRLVGGSIGTKVQELIKPMYPGAEIEVLPWVRAYRLALQRPNTLIFSIVRLPEREDKFHWLGVVETVETKLIAKASSSIQPIDELEQLKGLRIGVKRADAISNVLEQHGFEYGKTMTDILSTTSTMDMLQKDRVDVIPANEHIIDYYCQINSCDRSDFRDIYTMKKLSSEFYIAASLGTDKHIINSVKNAFASRPD